MNEVQIHNLKILNSNDSQMSNLVPHDSNLQYFVGGKMIVFIFLWLDRMKIEPPPWMYDNISSYRRGIRGETIAMSWIKNIGVLPPNQLLHDSVVQDNDGYTMMMYWIEHKRSKDIPLSIRHISTLTNNIGMTPMMLWISNHRCKVPIFLHHDPNIQDKDFQTAAMYWIIFVHQEPPEYLIHNTNIRNKNGFNLKQLLEICLS